MKRLLLAVPLLAAITGALLWLRLMSAPLQAIVHGGSGPPSAADAATGAETAAGGTGAVAGVGASGAAGAAVADEATAPAADAAACAARRRSRSTSLRSLDRSARWPCSAKASRTRKKAQTAPNRFSLSARPAPNSAATIANIQFIGHSRHRAAPSRPV